MSAARTETVADTAALADLQGFLSAHWASSGLPAEAAFAFELALEELFINVATHGHAADRTAHVVVELSLTPDSAEMRLSDDGPAFDPASIAEANTAATLDERAIGGLGLHLVRTLMDEVHYERCDGRNVTTLRKRYPSAAAA